MPNQNGQPKGRIVATYDYRGATGGLLFQVVRFEPKSFRQRRPDGNGGWIWRLGNTPRVLYRLSELHAASIDAWVFVVEGEKDADNLAEREMVATTCPQGAGKWRKLSDDSALEGRKVVIIADKDNAGREHAKDVAQRLYGRVADLRVLELPGAGKDASDWLAAGGTIPELLALVDATPLYQQVPIDNDTEIEAPEDDRPEVYIDTEEHRVVNETVAALTGDPDIYQRGGILVRVVRYRSLTDGIKRSSGSAIIQAVPAANLRDRMTKFVRFTKSGRDEEKVAAHPAAWLVSAVLARSEWAGIRPLFGVSDAPILRPDGTICQEFGYDEPTGVLLELGNLDFPPIHPDVSLDHAQVAMEVLEEAIIDFPFEAPEHKSAWYAGLLTPLARFAFAGPSPLFLIDANVRGAGKGLLAQTIGHIVLGREMPVSSYAHDSEEMRKKLTAIAIAGDRLILFDNLEGLFGNDALDRALTSTWWKDRILGKSEEVVVPLMPAWFATGNNVQVAADTTRRIIHIRLDCLTERPEERSGFRHENLLTWIDENRGRLLSAALTILSAYLRKGRPQPGLSPLGSFEGWSSVIREAIIWIGLPDPCLTRTRLAESSDTTAEALQQLMAAWNEYDHMGQGIVLSPLIQTLYPAARDYAPSDEASAAMRAALEMLVNSPPGKPPNAKQVGNKLRRFRRRVVKGMYLDTDPQRGKQGMVWRLIEAGGSS